MKNTTTWSRAVAACVLLLVMAAPSFATVYRPGLIQAKFDAQDDSTSDILTATNAEIVLGTVMADVQADGNNYATVGYTNTITGTVYHWNAKNTTFGYKGQILLTGGAQYVFGKWFDDGARISIAGTEVMNHSAWDSFATASTNPVNTGWVDFEVRVYDGDGGKGPSGKANTWGTDLGLGYNTTNHTAQTPKAAWSHILDPGDMSFLRCRSLGESFLALNTTTANESTYTFNVTTMPESNSVLTVCMGTADAGEDFAAWAQTNVFTVAAGTNMTDYSVTWPGTGTPWIKLCLAGTDSKGAFVAWSDAFEATLEPVVTASVSSYSYTNAVFSALLSYLGLGAASAQCYLEVSKNADMSSPVYSAALGIAQTAVPATLSATVVGLLTNTTYYVRVSATNSSNAASSSSVLSFTTLNPTAATITGTYLSNGFSYGRFAWALTGYGDDSASADIYLDVAADASFASYTSFAAATVTTNGLPVSGYVSATGLVHSTTYYARLRAVNTWGLTRTGATMTFTTTDVPFRFSPVGAVATATGLTILDTLTEIDSGVSVNVTLTRDGTTVQTWSGLTAVPTSLMDDLAMVAGSSATVTYTFSCTLNSEDFSSSVSRTVTAGQNIYVAGSMGDLTNFYPALGDSVSLPVLAIAGSYYRVLNTSIAALASDGATVNVLTNGATGIEYWEMTATGAALVVTSPLIVPPKASGSGRVWLWKGTSSSWCDATAWTCLSDRSAVGYPDGADDVALALFNGSSEQTLALNGDVTVGELYMGTLASSSRNLFLVTSGGTHRLTFAKSDGTAGAIRLTGGGADFTVFGLRFGEWNGNSAPIVLNAGAHGLDFDFGYRGDPMDRSLWSNHLARVWFARATIEIPEGSVFHYCNCTPKDSAWFLGDSQEGNVWFFFETYSALSGAGVFWHDAAGPLTFRANCSAFSGTIRTSANGAIGQHDFSDRQSMFHMRSDTASNAVLEVAGYYDGGYCVGDMAWGNTHGYGAWGPYGNELPYRGIRAYGGKLTFANEAGGWTPGSVRTNLTACLDAVRGMTGIGVGAAGSGTWVNNGVTYAQPTNTLTILSLTNSCRGTIYINDPRTSAANPSLGAITTLGGFLDQAIGSPDPGTTNGVYKVVPWILAVTSGSTTRPAPARVNANNEMIAPILKAVNLADVTDPAVNAYNSWSITQLATNTTINSYVVCNNGKGPTWNSFGAGKTLTITSGALAFWNSDSKLGEQANYEAGESNACGVLNFPNTAYVYASAAVGDPNEIWCTVKAPHGFVSGLSGALLLGGDQTGIDDEVVVNSGTLILGSLDGTIGTTLDVPVRIVGGGSKVLVTKTGGLETSMLEFEDVGGYSGKFQAPDGQVETVSKFFVNGVSMPRGTYGSTNAYVAVDHVDSAHFVGTGVVKVTLDEIGKPYFYIRIR